MPGTNFVRSTWVVGFSGKNEPLEKCQNLSTTTVTMMMTMMTSLPLSSESESGIATLTKKASRNIT